MFDIMPSDCGQRIVAPRASRFGDLPYRSLVAPNHHRDCNGVHRQAKYYDGDINDCPDYSHLNTDENVTDSVVN